jgi:excisionase family DNA binding protein
MAISPEPVEREWIGVDDLARWLDVPNTTIRQWRYRGIGPRAHKIGRHVRYRRADVEAWLAEQRDPQPAV